MQSVTTTFDEIHHVHRNRASRTAPKHTVFSFVSEGKYTAYVTVPGWPRLDPGMSVIALLRDPGDWKSLVGWLDIETGKTVAPSPNRHLGSLIFLSVWIALGFIFMWPGASRGQVPQAPLLITFFVAWIILSVAEYRGWRKAQADLIAIEGLVSTNVV